MDNEHARCAEKRGPKQTMISGTALFAVTMQDAYGNVPFLWPYIHQGAPWLMGNWRRLLFTVLTLVARLVDGLYEAVQVISGMRLFEYFSDRSNADLASLFALEDTVLAWALPLLGVAVTAAGLLFILNQAKQAKAAVGAVIVALAIVFLQPFLFAQLNEFTKSAVAEISPGSPIGAEILAKGTVRVSMSYIKKDLYTQADYYASKSVDNQNIYHLDAGETIPYLTSVDLNGLQAAAKTSVWTGFKSLLGITDENAWDTYVVEVMGSYDQDAAEHGLDNSAWPFKYGLVSYLYNNEGTSGIATTRPFQMGSLTSIEGLREGVFRYDFKFFELLSVLAIILFTLFSTLVKLARVTFELIFKRIILPSIAATDLGSGRWKILIGDIVASYLIFIVNMLLLNLFIPIATTIATSGGMFAATQPLGGFIPKLAVQLGLALMVMDGPEVIKKLFGVDSGVNGPFGPLVAARLVAGTTKWAGRQVKNGYNLADSAVTNLTGRTIRPFQATHQRADAIKRARSGEGGAEARVTHVMGEASKKYGQAYQESMNKQKDLLGETYREADPVGKAKLDQTMHENAARAGKRAELGYLNAYTVGMPHLKRDVEAAQAAQEKREQNDTTRMAQAPYDPETKLKAATETERQKQASARATEGMPTAQLEQNARIRQENQSIQSTVDNARGIEQRGLTAQEEARASDIKATVQSEESEGTLYTMAQEAYRGKRSAWDEIKTTQDTGQAQDAFASQETQNGPNSYDAQHLKNLTSLYEPVPQENDHSLTRNAVNPDMAVLETPRTEPTVHAPQATRDIENEQMIGNEQMVGFKQEKPSLEKSAQGYEATADAPTVKTLGSKPESQERVDLESAGPKTFTHHAPPPREGENETMDTRSARSPRSVTPSERSAAFAPYQKPAPQAEGQISPGEVRPRVDGTRTETNQVSADARTHAPTPFEQSKRKKRPQGKKRKP